MHNDSDLSLPPSSLLQYPTEEDIVLQLADRVGEAQRIATQSLKEMELRKNGKRSRGDDDEEEGGGDKDQAQDPRKKVRYPSIESLVLGFRL